MNAITFGLEALPAPPFDRACAEVNEWRGRCMNAFSRAEAHVTECLLALAAAPDRGARVRLPHLVGQRYEALASAVGPSGPFAMEGAKASDTLKRFQAHDSLRTMLCHGVGEVVLDRRGRWTLILRNLCLRSGQPHRDIIALRRTKPSACARS